MKNLRYISAIILAAFGLLTFYLSSTLLFDIFGDRANSGTLVMPVVVANLVSSLLYLFAAYGFVQAKNWTLPLLLISATILSAAFDGLQFHIYNGDAYQNKTPGALIFRIAVTLIFVAMANFTIKKANPRT
ncbi:MAG TPA: hypothetical protein DCQ31_09930 [Bacteroidales bacterium]|nr:hypothetical protein [Bacteroidales bacterium]